MNNDWRALYPFESHQHVIAGLIKHMEHFQATDFECDENAKILEHLEAARAMCQERQSERRDRGVLYDHTKP